MRVRGYEITYPRLLLVGLVIMLVTAGIIGLSTSSTAFGSYNPGWEGTSELRTLAANTGATTEVSQQTAIYTTVAPSNTTAFILSPTTTYNAPAVNRIHEFLLSGGTVVVAADFDPTANSLLADLGVTARFDGRPVRDEQHYYRGPGLPVATNVTEQTPVTENVSRLTLNYPTFVDPGQNSTILVNTSGFAYVDGNGNQTLDDTETLRERPVVVTESVGDGQVIVVSDPSLFINAMLHVPDNSQFATNLVADSDTVVFDYSHRAGIPWAVALVAAIAEQPFAQLAVVLVVTGVAIAGWRRHNWITIPWIGTDRPAEPDVGLSSDAVRARITGRHPEWDQERVERVAKGIMSDAPSEDKND